MLPRRSERPPSYDTSSSDLSRYRHSSNSSITSPSASPRESGQRQSAGTPKSRHSAAPLSPGGEAQSSVASLVVAPVLARQLGAPSPHISPHLHTSPHISPHLPIASTGLAPAHHPFPPSSFPARCPRRAPGQGGAKGARAAQAGVRPPREAPPLHLPRRAPTLPASPHTSPLHLPSTPLHLPRRAPAERLLLTTPSPDHAHSSSPPRRC